MAVTSTPAYPQSGESIPFQLTSSNTTSDTSDLVAGTANGKKVKELIIHSSGSGPRPGSKLAIKLYNGTNSRVLRMITLPGGDNAIQAQIFFDNLWLQSTSYAIRAAMIETLPSNCNLDGVIHSELY